MNDFQVGASPLAHNPLLFAQTLVQALEEGVATLNGNNQLTFCNPAFGQLLGRSAASLVGQSLGDLFPEGLPPDERADARYRREVDGSRDSFSVRIVPVPSPGDQPPGERLVILKPALANASLVYDGPDYPSEEEVADVLAHPFLEKITSALPGVVTVYNAHTGRYTYVGKGVASLLGYDPNELWTGGLSFLHRLIHPQDLAAVQQYHDARRHQGETSLPAESFEYRVRHRNGTWKWLRSTGVVLDRDPEGHVLHIVDGWLDVTEPREAASTFRRQAALLANAQSVANFGLWEYHVANGRIDWSDEMYHIFGYRPGEVTVDMALYAKVLHPDDRDHFQEEVAAILRNQQPYVSERRIYRPDGTLRHLVSRTDVAKDDAGNVAKVTGLTMDVTELQHTRSALHEKQRLIERITDTTPDILYIYDLKAGRNVYANRRLPEVLGFTVEEIQAMRDRFLALFTHADDYPKVLDAMQQLATSADHDVVEVEYRLMDPQGNWHWFYDRATIFTRDPDGSVREVLGSSQDITERKLAQEKLTESEYFIKQVADATPDGLYVYDLQLGRSVYNNRQIYQMLGYSYEAFHALGTSTTQTITHPDDLPRRLAHFERLAGLADGEVADLEYRVGTTGGEWRWVHSRDSVFKRTSTGAPWQILGIVQDVTERKKGVQALAYKDHLIGQMLANFPLVLTRINPEGTVLECTGSGLRDLNLHDNELRGANVFSLYPRMAPYLREVMNGNKVTFLYDVEVDGERKNFQNYYFYDPGQACAVGFSIDVTEQKEAEEQLAESRQFIEQITQAVPQIIYVFDLIEGRNLYINREVYASLGYSQAQVAGMGDGILAALMHPDERDLLAAHFARVAAGPDQVHELEYRMKDAQGNWRWFFCRDILFKRTPGGQPWQVLGSTQDITDRKRIETRVQESERLLRESQEIAHVGSFSWDLKADAITWTDEHYRIFGLPTGGPLHLDTVAGYYHPDDRQRVIESLRRTIDTGVPFDCNFRVVRPDGQERHLWSRAKPFYDEQGEALRLAGSVLDMTDLKRAEAELRESKQFIQQIADASPDHLYVFDLTRNELVYINREIYDSLGYRPEELYAQGNTLIASLMHPEDIPRVTGHLAGFRTAREGELREVEYRLRDSRGRWRWILARETVFKRDALGVPFQITGVSRDITDRRAAEEELRDKNKIIQGILSNLPVILTRIDAQGVIRESIGAGLRRIGRQDGEIVGYNVFTDDRYASVAGYLREVLRGNSLTFVGSPVYEGKPFYFLNYYYFDAAQRMAVGFSLDITTQHETEQKLKRSEEQLRELNAGLERRVAERTAELAASEERYRVFVQQSSEAIWRFELQGIPSIDPTLPEDEQIDLVYRHVYLAECNDTMARMYGYDSAAELIGAPLAQMLPRTEPANLQYLRSFIRSGYRLANAESVEPDREGNVKYFLNNLLGIAENGKLVRAWGIQRDITDRKRAEEALREKEQEYRSLVTATSQMIWFTNPEGLITDDIPLWRRYTGQGRQEVAGYGWADALHPDDKARAAYTWRRAVENCQVYEAEYRLRSRYGEYRWFFARGVPIFDRNGNVKKWIGASNDIHDRKLAEEALRRSEKRFRVALENSPVTVFECDADLRYTWVYNPRLGTRSEGLLGKRDDEIAPPAVAEKMMDYKREALALGRSGRFNLHVSHGGQHYYYDIVTEPLHDQAGAVVGLTVASIDVSPQRRVEEALRTSEERLEMAVRAAGIGIFDWRIPEDHVLWTEQEERLYGLAPGTFGGTTGAWAGYVLPEDLPEVQRQLREHLARRDTELPMQYRIQRADGAIRWIEGAGKFLYADDGTPLRAVGINMDITERKLADQALRQSESRFRRLFESDLVGIIFSDREGVITDANNAFLTLLGYGREDLASRALCWKDLTPPEYADLDAEAVREMMEKGVVSPYEKEFFRKDGSRVAILIGASLLKETTPGTAVGFVLDISERKAARERLHLSEERFRLVAEATNEGIWDWDIRADRVWRNEGYYKLFGYPPGHANANLEGWQQRLHPEEAARVRQGVEEALHGDKDNWADEYRIQKMDGSYAYVMDRAYILRDGQGRPVRMIGSKIDLTALKETQLALEQQAIELKQSNADLEQFAYISSHDLQEPLNTAASFAKLLKRRYESRLDGDANDFIDFIVDATDRMKKIIRSLLEYSRVSSVGKETDAVPLEKVLGEVRSNLQQRLEETGADLQVGPMPTVRANETQLLQLFQNLVGNALKFRSEAPPVITVRAEEEPGHWLFRVTDNGIGMNMKYAGEKIFQVFQRLHSREEYEGTGIGLAICKKIVERHGGTIWAESQPGEGSVFYFTLKK